jgi:hypothetical protein
MTGRHKLVLAETSVLRQETNTTVPRLARSLQDTVKAEMTKRARARRASPKRLTIHAKVTKKRQASRLSGGIAR